MNYHLPINQQAKSELPTFVISGGEAVSPQKIYHKSQYPKLPSDLIKIVGRDGRNIYVPLSKVQNI